MIQIGTLLATHCLSVLVCSALLQGVAPEMASPFVMRAKELAKSVTGLSTSQIDAAFSNCKVRPLDGLRHIPATIKVDCYWLVVRFQRNDGRILRFAIDTLSTDSPFRVLPPNSAPRFWSNSTLKFTVDRYLSIFRSGQHKIIRNLEIADQNSSETSGYEIIASPLIGGIPCEQKFNVRLIFDAETGAFGGFEQMGYYNQLPLPTNLESAYPNSQLPNQHAMAFLQAHRAARFFHIRSSQLVLAEYDPQSLGHVSYSAANTESGMSGKGILAYHVRLASSPNRIMDIHSVPLDEIWVDATDGHIIRYFRHSLGEASEESRQLHIRDLDVFVSRNGCPIALPNASLFPTRPEQNGRKVAIAISIANRTFFAATYWPNSNRIEIPVSTGNRCFRFDDASANRLKQTDW